MVDKRSAEGENGSEPKRARTEGQAALPNMDAIAKAKALLEKQKALQEKLKKLPQAGAKAAPAVNPALASPLNPAGAPLVDPVVAAAAAAKAAEVASRLGLQVSIAPAPIAAAAAAAGGGLGGVRPMLAGAGPLAARPPKILRLDAQGREVDELGRPVVQLAPVASSLVNQRRPEAAAAAPPEEPAGPADEDFVDASLETGAERRLQRRARGFTFVEEGTYMKEAENMRLRRQYGDKAFRKPPRGPRGPVGPTENPNLVPLGAPPVGALGEGLSDANLVPIGQQPVEVSELEQLQQELPEARDPPPTVEWWDKPLLEGGMYYTPRPQEQQQQGGGAEAGPGSQKEQQAEASLDPEAGDMKIRTGKITLYVEHPVPLDPPAEAPPPEPRPLMLTPKELKKLRTQRRQAREKEKQELIRQGLLEPPKPKIKISNMYRVLTEASVDPTAIEQRVRGEMQERQAAHDDRNLARMLTPAERRDKKLRKLFDDSGVELITAVYRVGNLGHTQHRWKVEVNAQENKCTGIMLLVAKPSFSLVVVEGCGKSLKRMHKLMLRRIDWEAQPLGAGPGGGAGAGQGGAGEGGGQQEEEEEEEDEGEQEPNTCQLVWEGVVKEATFKKFVREEVATPAAARAWLEARGCGHYWDAAAHYDPDAAPQQEL